VAEDVALGKISAERARQVYGVVLDPTSMQVDTHATTAERARLMQEGAL